MRLTSIDSEKQMTGLVGYLDRPVRPQAQRRRRLLTYQCVGCHNRTSALIIINYLFAFPNDP